MPLLVRFPDPRRAAADDADGIVAVGGDLRADTLLAAYRQGIFPWPVVGIKPVVWFCPPERAILEFKNLRVPRSLAKIKRQAPFRFTLDADFPAVIRACAEARRPDGGGTWITRDMQKAYRDFHRRGYAHSVEAWDDEGLAGGLYGVEVDGAFAGESMFFARANASKLALLFLVEHLAARGLDWIDIQVMTPHMEALGAHLVSRDRFLDKLAATRARGLKLFDELM